MRSIEDQTIRTAKDLAAKHGITFDQALKVLREAKEDYEKERDKPTPSRRGFTPFGN